MYCQCHHNYRQNPFCNQCLQEVSDEAAGSCEVCNFLFPESSTEYCAEHTLTCAQCQENFCQSHTRKCAVCKEIVCVLSPNSMGDRNLGRMNADTIVEPPTGSEASSLDCAFLCKACKRVVCQTHQDRCLYCGDIVCDECMNARRAAEPSRENVGMGVNCGVCVPCPKDQCDGAHLIKCANCSNIYCNHCDVEEGSMFHCPRCDSDLWTDATQGDIKSRRKRR